MQTGTLQYRSRETFPSRARDGASLARNELHASLPLATDAPIISAFLLVCSRVNRESLAKYKFLKRYDAEKKLHCMKLQLIVV